MISGRILYRYGFIFLLTCLMLWVFSGELYSCNGLEKTISGTVTEKNSGDFLELVHVYISHSTAGTTTDEHGRFEFTTDLTGEHHLVFSFVGYQTKMVGLNLDAPGQHFTYTVEMETRPAELEEIEVVASNVEWQRNFEEFNRQFIGTTEYASETFIQNPWVLDFDRNSSNQLVAVAAEPLQINNDALGYRLHVDLAEFVWNTDGETGFFTYEVKFEEYSSENLRRVQTWERNRARAYRGSFEHFLTSLYQDNLSRNRFEIVLTGGYHSTSIPELGQIEVRQRQLGFGRTSSVVDEKLKGYRLQQPVDILYGRHRWGPDNRLRARIVPVLDRGEFFVTNEGRLLNPLSLRLDGYWRTHRVANILPVDYTAD